MEETIRVPGDIPYSRWNRTTSGRGEVSSSGKFLIWGTPLTVSVPTKFGRKCSSL